MSTPIFPPHKTRSASSQEKQWGSLASCVIRLRTSRAGLSTSHCFTSTLQHGNEGCLLGEARKPDMSPRDPQNGPTASLPGAAIIHSHLHTCIRSSSRRWPRIPLGAHSPAAGSRDSRAIALLRSTHLWGGRRGAGPCRIQSLPGRPRGSRACEHAWLPGQPWGCWRGVQ